MGIRFEVIGGESDILLEKESVVEARYFSDTPDSSNARAADLGITVELKGKIISTLDGDTEDDTRKLALWSLVPSEQSSAYRNVNLEIIAAGKVIRKINLPNAFVVDYGENYDENSGTGNFYLKIKQKKEKVKNVAIEGGYQSTVS